MSVKRFGMCFIGCKDALFWRYDRLEKTQFIFAESPGWYLFDCRLDLEPPRGAFVSCLGHAPRVGRKKKASLTLFVPRFRHLEWRYYLLDSQCASPRSHCHGWNQRVAHGICIVVRYSGPSDVYPSWAAVFNNLVARCCFLDGF